MGLGIESQTQNPTSRAPSGMYQDLLPHLLGTRRCHTLSPCTAGTGKGTSRKAPIGPTGPQAPDPLPPGGLETSARVHFISRAWDSLLLPLSFASATQSHSFSASKWGLWGSLHQGSGAALKGGTRGLTPALWRDLLCLCKALRSAPALRPTEGNAAGSGDLFCRRQL